MKKKYTAQDTYKALKRVYIDIDQLDRMSFEMEDIDPRDHPDYVDARIAYATYQNGQELTEEELDELNHNHTDIVYDAVWSQIY